MFRLALFGGAVSKRYSDKRYRGCLKKVSWPNFSIGKIMRVKRFTGIPGPYLILICVVFLGGCAHPSANQPDPSPYEDFIGIYRGPLNHLAPVRRGICPMHPSCSEYSRQAVQKHGFTVGWAMAMDRLLRCGRDELTRAPKVLVNGEWRFYDPLSANDNWWYSAGDDIDPESW